MSKTDTTGKGLESLIMPHMTGTDGLLVDTGAGAVADTLDEAGNLDEDESEET